MRLEIEEAALANEDDPASKARLEDLAKELADLRAEADALRAQWEAERHGLRRVQSLREEMDRAREEAERAERNYDLNKAAELRLGKLPQLQRRLAGEEEALAERFGPRRLLPEVVTDDQIASIVSRWTGLPGTPLPEGERGKTLRLGGILHHPDSSRPVPQVLEDGSLTDGQGRTAGFRNTVIIMTSNIGSEYLLEGAASEGEIEPGARERVLAEMRSHFRPEFLNRVDEIVLFKPLTQDEIEQIVDLMLNDLRARLGERQITVEITPEARRFIARQGFDPVYGARPLRRFIAREVETRIGRALLSGDIRPGAVINVAYSDGELTVTYPNQP